MIITFFLSLVPIVAGALFAVAYSGGTVLGILDLPSFLEVFVSLAVFVLLSGNTRLLCRVFSTKKRYKAMTLAELLQAERAVVLSQKFLLALVPVFTLIYMVYLFCYGGEWQKSQRE